MSTNCPRSSAHYTGIWEKFQKPNSSQFVPVITEQLKAIKRIKRMKPHPHPVHEKPRPKPKRSCRKSKIKFKKVSFSKPDKHPGRSFTALSFAN
jgi:hypothetical protein